MDASTGKESSSRGTKNGPPDRDAQARVLALIEALARELRPERRGPVSLQSSLQRDLGFDSLGLSELLVRAEREFKVRLPDDLLGRLDKPLDLIQAIEESAASQGIILARPTHRLPPAAVESLPERESTLIGVLDWQVRNNGDRPHILLSDGYSETETITYRDLRESAARVAHGLRNSGIEISDCVGIMLPTGREFFEAFFGVLLAGGVPVPMYPPLRLSQLEEHLRRQAMILRKSLASALIIPPEGKSLAGMLRGQIPSLRHVHTVADLTGAGADSESVQRRPEDLAMLQFTSGSTGDPKGVMLTHANLLANIRAMGQAIDATSKDVFVSWLPLYHDLGLIGAWLGSLYYAVPVIIMSPLRFIVRPESWLWAIHRNAATISAAPNFAFELCVNKIDDRMIEGLDLSSLRLLANGAEPVSVQTIDRFTKRFEPYGFRPEAMTPVYGLAENAVGLAFSPPGRMPLIDHVDRRALSQSGMASPADAGDPNPMTFVSSGVPLPDNEVRIVDELRRELPERRQGRLEFRSTSATSGYYRDPDKTSALIRNGWLDSGDLAYISNGNVFITGRIKDIIFKAGRNIYPEEIETTIGNLTGIRKGCVAAFALPEPKSGTEKLIVVAETRSTDTSERAELQNEAVRRVSDVLDVAIDELELVAPHAVPKTSSGKIRRSATRALFETGRLNQRTRALWVQMLRLHLTSASTLFRRGIQISLDLVYAAWWWSVLVILGAIAWPSVLLLPARGKRWAFLRSIARLALKLMGVPVHVSNRERISPGHIIVANHSSYFDSLVLTAILPGEPAFVAKSEFSNQLVAGPFLRKLGTAFVERSVPDMSANELARINDVLEEGRQLAFFPEATLVRNPGLLPFRLGAFHLAATAGVPVLPIVIKGTRTILRGGQWYPRHGVVEVAALEPLRSDGRDFAAAVQLRDAVRSQMLDSCGEPDLAEKVIVFGGADTGDTGA